MSNSPSFHQKYTYSATHLNTIHTQFTYNGQFLLAAWKLILLAELLNEKFGKNIIVKVYCGRCGQSKINFG